MKHIVKTLSLLSIIAVIPGAMAATSRVSVASKGASRLPSIAGYIVAANNAATGTTIVGTSTTSYLADPDCITNYTDCITGVDACGSDFEDCSNSILLHAKMPSCAGVLAQCTAAGRASLFGASDLTAINTSATQNSDGEITAYTYPTMASHLGQLINKAQIENRLSASDCVKRYTSCLKKDSVCGEEFELCTDGKEFKKQALFCESVLARCQNDGKSELFGSATAAGKLAPESGSRLDEMIKEGAALAVNNAVATCNKVTDQCILNACSKNPNKCIEGRPELLIRISDATNGGKAVTTQDLMDITKITEKRDVSAYIRQECMQTIGSNKYCYMTVKGNVPNKASVLSDPDNVDEVFTDMYSGEFGRFSALKDKINQIVDNFDARVQDKCIDTMSSCAMRSCGSGIGSVCYKQSRVDDGSVNITKSPKSYQEIKSACRAIVDTDSNCQYAAVLSEGGLYNDYLNDTQSVFTTLFPENSTTGKDPIGIVASLNASLATSYNDAAIENMKKQCQTVALSCVKSMCGKDYTNCYRNRTDIVSGTYNTGNGKLDRSMNKMGGVLDYNIVIGLCMNTVKNADICSEHLKVAAADWRNDVDEASWNTTTVRSGWLDANSTGISKTYDNSVVIGCQIPEANASEDCPAFSTASDNNGSCVGVMDEDGCVYSEPVYQGMSEYVLENAGKTLFQELLRDVEMEAQSQFNAKLTKEQNICLAQNNGGIMGASDNGSTFMWVKLKNNKIPKNYQVNGLKTKEFTASNDLYGSFCRARITVKSDDKLIQKYLGDKATAYFATGDSFVCGSWIDEKTLKDITDDVAENARTAAGKGTGKEARAYIWGTVAPALIGGVGGFVGMDALQRSGSSLGGLLNGDGIKQTQAKSKAAETCLDEVAEARVAYNRGGNTQMNNAINHANTALRNARSAGAKFNNVGTFTNAKDEYEWVDGYAKYDVDSAIEALDGSDANKYPDAKKGCDAVDLCKNSVARAKELLKTPTLENGRNIVSLLNTAIDNCKDCGDVTKLKIESDKVDITLVKTAPDFLGNLDKVEEACQKLLNNATPEVSAGKNWAAAGVGALVAGGLGAGITASVLESKYQNAADEAVKQWYEEIGDHIQCYLGTEELGSYGDVIGIEIE